ncbi:MAG: class I SAM-dependent methyltransferase [Candidatus Methanoperedens sp.]|nr:class I SAM-dependent methyltransferase [Candidatus Methanoperedens sp.]
MKHINEIKPLLELWTGRIADYIYCIDPAYWSNTAREYDRKIVANGKLLRKLKKYVDSDSTVLDIGAGTGYLTLALAPFVKKVTAVEPADGMLNVLKEKAESSGTYYLGIS